MSIINVSPMCVASGSHNMGIRVLPKLMALSFSFSALQDMWDFENWTYLSIWKKSHGQRPLKPQHSLSKLTWLHVGSNKVLGSCSKIPLRGLETFHYPKLLFFPHEIYPCLVLTHFFLCNALSSTSLLLLSPRVCSENRRGV